jgi:hypothetical protein
VPLHLVLHSAQRGATGRRTIGGDVAQRPDPSPDVPMSAADLAEVRRTFSMLSTDGLRSAYADGLERCRLDKRGRPPRCEHIQGARQALEGAAEGEVSLTHSSGLIRFQSHRLLIALTLRKLTLDDLCRQIIGSQISFRVRCKRS